MAQPVNETRDEIDSSGLRVVPQRRLAAPAAAALLTLHAGLLAWSAWRHSPVVVEPAHLAAGLSHVLEGRYDLYRVNPPLVRSFAALPTALAGVQTDWTRADADPLKRCEFEVGQDLLRANGARSLWLFTLARWACIPFSLLGGACVFWWARDLFGEPSGLLALALWCTSPAILAHSALITPDAHAASLAVAAAYLFHRWQASPTWSRVLWFGGVMGLAQLTKTTLLLLYPALLLAWAIRLSGGRDNRGPAREAAMLATGLAMSLLVLNAGYNFEGSGRALGDYRFQSRLLAGEGVSAGNLLASLGGGALCVPLPANYLQGIDAQRLDFEQGRRSYLSGAWSDRGWASFYFYAALVKTPLGTLALLLVSAILFLFAPVYRGSLACEAALLLPPLVIFAVVSSQTGFSIHPRYALPALPFVLIWLSRVALAYRLRQERLAGFVTVALAASVGSSLWCFPHELSYFNEAAGGPRRGHTLLVDSGIAWGQDLIFLKEWLDSHPDQSPPAIAAFGYLNPAALGIDFRTPIDAAVGESSTAPPSRCILDVNHLMGSPECVPTPTGDRQFLGFSDQRLSELRHSEPIARAGYSFLVFEGPEDRAQPAERSDQP